MGAVLRKEDILVLQLLCGYAQVHMRQREILDSGPAVTSG